MQRCSGHLPASHASRCICSSRVAGKETGRDEDTKERKEEETGCQARWYTTRKEGAVREILVEYALLTV